MRKIIFILASAALLLPSCGGDEGAAVTVRLFDDLASETVNLYKRIHPLRCSRLGITSCDSLLFTFSEDEISSAVAAIDTLLSSISKLPAVDLDGRRIADSRLLTDWMKGERFALAELVLYRSDPLLYCWMAEEALFGIPTRPDPPAGGERIAYGKRLSLLAGLLGNGSGLITDPAGHQLELALERLDTIIEQFPDLARLVGERYNGEDVDLGTAINAVRAFRGRVVSLIGTRRRGRAIMGMENLGHVLKYSEHLDLDPSEMIHRAEKSLERYSREYTHGLGRNEDPAGPPIDADSFLIDIEEKISSSGLFGKRKRPTVPTRRYRAVYEPLRIPVNPYLTLPVSPERAIYSIFPFAETKNACTPTIMVPEPPKEIGAQLAYDLLLSTSIMTRPRRDRCRDRSVVRKIFVSETFHYGWKVLNIEKLITLLQAGRGSLEMLDARERVLAMARLILVLRFQSGTFTIESAAGYLRGIEAVPEDEIESEVMAASSSPARAFEGISLLLAEQLMKDMSRARGTTAAAGLARKLLLENNAIPLTLILPKVPK
jgi:hypothetical protein